jgi:hypothetical protein
MSKRVPKLIAAIAGVALGAATGCGEDFVFGDGSGLGGGGQGGQGATTTSGAGGTTGTGGSITTGGSGGTGGGTATGGGGGVAPCRGLAFNGASALVVVPDHGHLDGLQQITVEAWVYVTSSTRATILSHHRDVVPKAGYMLEHMNNKALAFRMFSGDSSPAEGGSVLTQIELDSWTHVAAVFDGTAIRLYLDGELKDGSPAVLSGGATGDFGGRLVIGANANDASGFFKGMMDEVRLSSVARYTGQSFTPPPGPFSSDADTVALWHFDESDGQQQVVDAKGVHNGTLGITAGPEPSDPTRVEVPCIVDMLP